MQALSAYDPVASVAFSQIGFTALYATFGASATSRINTGFTYRLTYQGVTASPTQAQIGGYDQGNAATEQYQAQIGTDFKGFSFDVIAGYAKNALAFASFAGATTARSASIPTISFARRPLNTGGVELLGRYEWDKFKFYLGYIYSLSVNPSNTDTFPHGVPSVAPGVSRSSRLRDDQRLHGAAQSSTPSGRACGMRCGPILTSPGASTGNPRATFSRPPRSARARVPQPAAPDAPAAAGPILFWPTTGQSPGSAFTPAFLVCQARLRSGVTPAAS